MDECLQELSSWNNEKARKKVIKILVNACGKILMNPTEAKFRRLPISKIEPKLQAPGLACLVTLGFTRQETHYTLADDFDSSVLESGKAALEALQQQILAPSLQQDTKEDAKVDCKAPSETSLQAMSSPEQKEAFASGDDMLIQKCKTDLIGFGFPADAAEVAATKHRGNLQQALDQLTSDKSTDASADSKGSTVGTADALEDMDPELAQIVANMKKSKTTSPNKKRKTGEVDPCEFLPGMTLDQKMQVVEARKQRAKKQKEQAKIDKVKNSHKSKREMIKAQRKLDEQKQKWEADLLIKQRKKEKEAQRAARKKLREREKALKAQRQKDRLAAIEQAKKAKEAQGNR